MDKSKESLPLVNVSIEELQEQYDKVYVLYKEKAGVLSLAVPKDNFPLVREVASDLSDLSYFLQQIDAIKESKKRLLNEQATKDVD